MFPKHFESEDVPLEQRGLQGMMNNARFTEGFVANYLQLWGENTLALQFNYTDSYYQFFNHKVFLDETKTEMVSDSPEKRKFSMSLLSNIMKQNCIDILIGRIFGLQKTAELINESKN